jgi:hypothetical protein
MINKRELPKDERDPTKDHTGLSPVMEYQWGS